MASLRKQLIARVATLGVEETPFPGRDVGITAHLIGLYVSVVTSQIFGTTLTGQPRNIVSGPSNQGSDERQGDHGGGKQKRSVIDDP